MNGWLRRLVLHCPLRPTRPVLAVALSLVVAMCLAPSLAHAAWPPNGAAVGVATNSQSNITALSDGVGGAFLVWEDTRAGGSRVYAQHVDSVGTSLWTANGVRVCTDNHEQTTPVLASDGAGGVFVVWSDSRGSSGIYGQRLNASGVLQWAGAGVQVNRSATSPLAPAVVAGTSSSAIVVFEGSPGASSRRVYAQRLNSGGTLPWGGTDVALCSVSADQTAPRAIADGSGGAVVVWSDQRTGSAGAKGTWGQRVNASGALLWAATGMAISDAGSNQIHHALSTDGGTGYLAVWEDDRNAPTATDLYAQRFNSSGVAQWTSTGVAVCTVDGAQTLPGIVPASGFGAIIVWQDARNTGAGAGAYAQRLNGSGVPQWTTDGQRLAAQGLTPVVASDGAGGAYVAFQTNVSNVNIGVTRLDNAGTQLWGTSATLCAAPGTQQLPRIVSDGFGAFVPWEDLRGGAGQTDVYAGRLLASGPVVDYTITASAAPGGSITPSGSVLVRGGSNATFTFTPDPGYSQGTVSVDLVNVGSPASYTFTNVQADHTIAVSFGPIQHTITASAVAHGTVSPSGAVPVAHGSNLNFVFTPDAHYHVQDVLVDAVSVGSPSSYQFNNVVTDHTLAVSFAIDSLTITASASGPGQIVPGGAVRVPYGGNQSFTMQPQSNPPGIVSSVSVDGAGVGTPSSYLFTNVITNHTISATFTVAPAQITASAGPGGTIVPSGVIAVPSGQNQSFAMVPGPGYEVFDITVDGQSVSAVTSYTFVAPAGSHSITASFVAVPPVDSANWITNGIVKATAVSPARYFIGGDFSVVGPYTGACATVGRSSGLLWPGFPAVNGAVTAITTDGAGGWFIGGVFDTVGSVPRQNLAHVDSAGAVTSWNPGADSQVQAMALVGDTLYVGGFFSVVGGQSRSRIAAVDAQNGAVLPWNPGAGGGNVYALTADHARLFVGGSFTTLGGQPRTRLGAFDRGAAAVATWSPTANSSVYAMAIHDSVLYAGGNFTLLAGQARSGIGALHAMSGTLLGWDPGLFGSRPTQAVVCSDTNVFIGAQNRLYRVSLYPRLDSNDCPDWTCAANFGLLDGPTGIWALATAGDRLLVGGDFGSWQSPPCGPGCDTSAVRYGLAEFDVEGNPQAWHPVADGVVRAMGVAGSKVCVGGLFASVGGAERRGIAAFERATGYLSGWRGAVSGAPNAMLVDGARVILGGRFVGPFSYGNPDKQLVAVKEADGTLDEGWFASEIRHSLKDFGDVNTLTLAGYRLVVGGNFDLVESAPRRNLAAFLRSGGTPIVWNPGADSTVWVVRGAGDTVFVGGDFSSIGGVARSRVAALDLLSETSLAWNPGADSTVRALALIGSSVFVGGSFSQAGGSANRGIAKLDRVSGASQPWASHAGGTYPYVYALEPRGADLYAGGAFESMGGSSRRFLARLRASDGQLATWDPAPDNTVFALSAESPTLLAGGGFFRLGGLPRGGFAVLTDPVSVDAPEPLAGPMRLGPAWPNPMNGRGAIAFDLPQPDRVRLELVDVAGRVVRHVLTSERLAAGTHRVPLATAGLAPGIYYVRLRGTNLDSSRRIVVVH